MKLFIRSLFIFLLFIFSSALIIAVPVHAQDNLDITEFSIPTDSGYPYGITAGPDGNLWFTEIFGNKIGQITPGGTITEFSIPTVDSYPQGITAGPDGNLWFIENGGNNIGRVTPNGIFTEFAIPTSDSGPEGITSGPDGNIWFTERWGNKIGRISMNGIVTEFPIPIANSYPYGITSGPDGNIWFTERYANNIGRITPNGTLTEFSLGSWSPYGITSGPDGNIWFTELDGNSIGRITTNGTITQFLIAPDVLAYDIVAGADGNLWFTEDSMSEDMGKIGKITTSGIVSTYPVANGFNAFVDITSGPDGNLWFTEPYRGKIGRVNLSSPTPTPTPTPTPAKTPLILIPGIGGSEFKSNETFTSTIKECGILPAFTYSTNDIVWVNAVIAGISPCDDYFDILKLKVDGQTPEYPQIVLNGTFFGGAYGGLIKFFTDNGYELNQNLFIFPYDWRKDIALTAPLLDQKINEIKTQTGSQKVDIVAHSMGGLVARNYIFDVGRASNVRKLFTLGTPHLGSVDSLKNLRFGGCLTKGIWNELANYGICLGVAPAEVKDIIQNMISGYELAPSQEYFNFYNGQDNKHHSPYGNNNQPLSYNEIKSFLTNLNYNTGLFNPSELFHSLDNQLINTNGVEITNIAGSGLPTLGQIVEKSVRNFWGNTVQKKDGFAINGDETVPLFSASLIDASRNKSLLGSAKVFYTNQEHGSLVSSGPALNLVKNILNNDSQLPDGVSPQPYHFNGTGVSVHSPINIHVYDSLGNHTGPTSNGDFEANISGSSYDTLDDAKFIFLPNDGSYDIKFEATDQGSFDFKIKKFENDVNTAAILYNDIPLATATKAEAILDTLSAQPPTLQVDQDGNGTTDKEVDPTFVLTGNAVYDYIPPEARIFIDQDKQDLTVIGIDSNPTTVTKLENTLTKKKNDAFYLITDAAGNSLKLDVREIDRNKKDRFRIYSIQYNNDDPIVLENNHFNVTYQDKKDKLNIKEQNYELKGEIKIRIQYNVKKNKSTIILKEPEGEKIKAVIDGLIILELNTDRGQLRTYFTQSST